MINPGKLDALFPFVSKASRYLGNEVNAVRKDLSRVDLKCALAFPDAYEVGMSHLGFQILYHLMNLQPHIACERVFAPWVDMEYFLRENNIPLCSLESRVPLSEFHIIGFSLQYELGYSNILNMLKILHLSNFSISSTIAIVASGFASNLIFADIARQRSSSFTRRSATGNNLRSISISLSITAASLSTSAIAFLVW